MRRKTHAMFALSSCALLVVFATAGNARAQDMKTAYPSMAPIAQYLMAQPAEIALARSGGPESISKDADVMVLGPHGYETAVKGKNGFVCMVERSWTAGIDDPDFWNPKIRAPICFNAAAARSNIPLTIRKTNSVLAARSKARIFADIKTAFDDKDLPAVEPGAMCYMMSKQQYLNDRDGHWRPHLMFFTPLTESASWGANMPGSPLIGSRDPEDRLTVFMIPIARWSDGTVASVEGH